MQPRRFGSTGLTVSPLGLGTMTWGRDTDAHDAGEMVRAFLDSGGTVIDTSNAQGVDFENQRDAVPANQNDAQPISQDAINGLGK